MIIDGAARFACRHEFVGLPLEGRPEFFRCHKCGFSKAIEIVIPGSFGVAAFRQAGSSLPVEIPALLTDPSSLPAVRETTRRPRAARWRSSVVGSR
jgi:hypothetical protein